MSVDVPKVEETTPVVTKPVETTATPAETIAPVATEPSSTEPHPVDTTMEPLGTTEPLKDEAVVDATPATEGVLGYKAPGLLKQFRFVKHFFWFSEEPLNKETLDAYVKSEKADVAHHHAAWAQETGKGVLFYAKRAEDKNAPAGLIVLAEAGGVTKVGQTDFSFKVGHHTHKFEAASQAERDSWVVAIQKIVEESKDLKADVTGRESYKKNMEGYSASPIVAGTAASATPKKSLDATTATNAATTKETGAPILADESSASSADESKHQRKEAEKQAKKDRSQSRKRNSVFGLFGKKDEETAHKKAEKEHEKEVKKVEKDHVKEEKKVEAEHKKEEAKAEHDSSKAQEAAEAAAVAAAPAAVVAADRKEEHKHEVAPQEEVTTPTEKKSKRTSVFGGFFGKNKVTSPTAEKSEKEIVPEVPAKDETPAVSETAPKLVEPIDTKPIDAAAVTAPVDHAEPAVSPVTAAEESKVAEPATHVDSTAGTTPKTEKKSFLPALFKKQEKKDELKEGSRTNEEAIKESPAVAPETAVAATETPATEVAPKETETAKEERPAREKRRTSLFGSLGTLKRKTEKSPAPESAMSATDDINSPEVKREKSPLPSKIGSLFRKPSKANHIQHATEHKTDATETKPEIVAPTSETEFPGNATVVEPKGDSAIVGDVVPEGLHTTVHDAVTQEPSEVKATA